MTRFNPFLPLCLAGTLSAQVSPPSPLNPGVASAPTPTDTPVLALLKTRNWADMATLSYVATAGNSQGQTIGFSNHFAYKWDKSLLVVKAGAVRVAATTVDRVAVGSTLEDVQVVENRTTRTTAENYYFNGRYDNRLKDADRYYWYAGAGWERNIPAGLENRYTSAGGFGRIWSDSKDTKFRTDAGLGYTVEKPIAEPEGFKPRYGTFNLTAELKQRIGPQASYGAELNLVENLTEGRDTQGTLRQGLTVTLNRTLALKVGYDLIYRSRPNLIGVDAYSPDLQPVKLGQVFVSAKKLDTLFTTSLVITF